MNVVIAGHFVLLGHVNIRERYVEKFILALFNQFVNNCVSTSHLCSTIK